MSDSFFRVQAPCRTACAAPRAVTRKHGKAGDAGWRPSPAAGSDFFDLREIELDRGRPAEDRDGDADLRLVVVDVLDRAVEIRERAFLDADELADFPLHLRARLL